VISVKFVIPEVTGVGKPYLVNESKLANGLVQT
jgi:hypothetical protein